MMPQVVLLQLWNLEMLQMRQRAQIAQAVADHSNLRVNLYLSRESGREPPKEVPLTI